MVENDSVDARRDRTRGPGRTGSTVSWASGIRWFAAEFLVVVSGVLVALALNAFYQDRVDAEREAGYIEQLAADLEESEAAFEAAVAGNEAERAKVMQLLAFFGENKPPSREQFDEVRVLSMRLAQPTLSTAQAVVETGDLQLIRDDALRSAIIQYVGAGEAYAETQDAIAWEWLTPLIRSYYGIVRPGLGPGHRLAMSPDELLAQDALYDITFDLQLAYSNHLRAQRGMLSGIRDIQVKIEGVSGDIQ